MKDIVYKIKAIRQMPAFQVLIGVNEQMGFPLDLGNFIFIPFFTKENNAFALSSKVFLEKKTCRVIKYQKILIPRLIGTNTEELLAFKKKALEQDMIFEIHEMPDGLRDIYNKAAEEIVDDKY